MKDVTNPCSPDAYSFSFDAFGTVVSLNVYCNIEIAPQIFRFLRSECRRYELLFSAFIPSSDIGRLNNAHGCWIPIADDTLSLLQASIDYCDRSCGFFDITAKPLIDLWDVHKETIPSEAQIYNALSHIDYHCIQLDVRCGKNYARLTDPHAAIDLGGTAKGWIADALCESLLLKGAENFLLSLGGNIATRGLKPNGEPFRIGIRNPNNHDLIVGTINLLNRSAVASGLSERYFDKNDIRYSHILDLKTGYPLQTSMQSVTLIGSKSADCDGFSTTLCILGMEDGPRYFSKLHEIEAAVFIDNLNGIRLEKKEGIAASLLSIDIPN